MGWTGSQPEGVTTKDGKTTDDPKIIAKIGYDELHRRNPREIVSVWESKFGSKTWMETTEDLVNCV
jgi:hypothetical protein